ncbi:WG repeat-containing protein [Flavobacterium hydatis]|uniref:WG repeat-containing protein n=1 Tax=Flavobacterium hydatis TaxID=991 RepID=A0A086A0Y4_FLAHY|nr:WG repeat-containing protein [Flavobacterium hydatis]KFF10348.1 hypothetical protein IW20_20990 [Flavobacterium hydatis]OXA92662.1 hypothetical protein B0A62_14775 [Flavobacterium hydatis]
MKVNKVLTINLLLVIVTSLNCVLAQTSAPIPVQKNGKWGFADDRGNIVIACEYEQVGSFKNGLAIVYDNCTTVHPYGEDVNSSYHECKQGIINTQGKLIIPIKYNVGQ